MTILELLESKGYAPGDYFNVCRTCGKEFVGDKRAITCAGCASEQVGAVAEPNAHSVLAEVRADVAELFSAITSYMAITGHCFESRHSDFKDNLIKAMGKVSKHFS